MTNNLKLIIEELESQGEKVDYSRILGICDEILAARRIFLAGAGRSGLMIKAFAMRLMHLGLDVHVVGDVTAPSVQAGDLLFVGSGSGETRSLVATAEKAKNLGLKIALCTIDDSSTLAKMADAVIVLPGASQKVQNDEKRGISVQPMGSSFEQLCLLVYDSVIMELMERLGKSADEMFLLHANLE